MEVNIESLTGWSYLGSNKNKYPNPISLIASRDEVMQDHNFPAYPTSALFKSKVNHRWYNAFGTEEGFPYLANQCELCNQSIRFNYYFKKDHDIKRVCKPCSKRVRSLNHELFGEAFDSNLCLICESTIKKGNVCSDCSAKLNDLKYCSVCSEWVINDKVKRRCDECLLKLFYADHTCGTGEHYESYCSHFWQECEKCNTRFLREHTCGDGTVCDRCGICFNAEHLCERRIYTCPKCIEQVHYGLYKARCKDCGNLNVSLRHRCYNEHKTSGASFKDTLCYCSTECPKCRSKHGPSNECFAKLLNYTFSTGKNSGKRVCQSFNSPRSIRAYCSVIGLSNMEKLYIKKMLMLFKKGEITEDELIQMADSAYS